MKRLVLVVAAISLLFAGVAREALGAVTVVNCHSNPAALQPAIDAAAAGAVLVIRGTCVGSFEIDRDLTLVGKWWATLDGDMAGTTLTIGPGAMVVVKDLTITGGNSEDGGGILNEGGRLTLIASHVTRNQADTGGGIYNEEEGSITIKHSHVTDNTADEGGGGINNDEGSIRIEHSHVSGNMAASGNGGGIRNGPGNTLTLVASHVTGNNAEIGGGISNRPNAMLTLTGSVVFKNTASSDAGGIFNAGDATLSASLVFFNMPNNCVGIAEPGCL